MNIMATRWGNVLGILRPLGVIPHLLGWPRAPREGKDWVRAEQIIICMRFGLWAVLGSGEIVGNMTMGQTDNNIDRQAVYSK